MRIHDLTRASRGRLADCDGAGPFVTRGRNDRIVARTYTTEWAYDLASPGFSSSGFWTRLEETCHERCTGTHRFDDEDHESEGAHRRDRHRARFESAGGRRDAEKTLRRRHRERRARPPRAGASNARTDTGGG